VHASHRPLGCHKSEGSSITVEGSILTLWQLLEGIGAISKEEGRKAVAHATGNYQANITIPIARENDDEAEAYDDAGGDDDMGMDTADGVLSAIQKVLSLHINWERSFKNFFLFSSEKLWKRFARALNAVKLGQGKFKLSRAVVYLKTTVLPWCWFSTWELAGLLLTKCFVSFLIILCPLYLIIIYDGCRKACITYKGRAAQCSWLQP